ncbi:hypothetical protein N8T08_004362 [Aspergillus melleus]|uniref:Uncharacterized protein n=1 Tax=Aspergillus melleus TaxID=138277 RepID=A0ACC3B454_9EURO|nr:hypothetical protein N8T08_004362 [Aspergillus melleus]
MCTEDHQKVSESLEDARHAFEKMSERSTHLANWLSNNPSSPPADIVVFSTFLTFSVVFGQIWWGSEEPERNVEGVRAVRRQIDAADALRTALDSSTGASPPIWEFHCDENWLDERGGYDYWDTREAERGGQVMRNLAELEGACQDNTLNLLAYLSLDVRENPVDPVEAVTFCKEGLDQWTDELRELYKLKFPPTAHISTVKVLSMGFTLLHELSHSKQVLGQNSYRDTSYSNGINSAAYGWEAVTEISDSPDDARKNADSFAFFAAAMYLDKYDWHTGFALTFDELDNMYSGNSGEE